MRREGAERTRLVGAHQARVARHIGREDRRQLSLKPSSRVAHAACAPLRP
jgi:hypothetical protein